jgi:hypothetical protein
MPLWASDAGRPSTKHEAIFDAVQFWFRSKHSRHENTVVSNILKSAPRVNRFTLITKRILWSNVINCDQLWSIVINGDQLWQFLQSATVCHKVCDQSQQTKWSHFVTTVVVAGNRQLFNRGFQLEERTECDKPNTIRTKDRCVKICSTWNFLMAEAQKWTKKQPKN